MVRPLSVLILLVLVQLLSGCLDTDTEDVNVEGPAPEARDHERMVRPMIGSSAWYSSDSGAAFHVSVGDPVVIGGPFHDISVIPVTYRLFNVTADEGIALSGNVTFFYDEISRRLHSSLDDCSERSFRSKSEHVCTGARLEFDRRVAGYPGWLGLDVYFDGSRPLPYTGTHDLGPAFYPNQMNVAIEQVARNHTQWRVHYDLVEDWGEQRWPRFMLGIDVAYWFDLGEDLPVKIVGDQVWERDSYTRGNETAFKPSEGHRVANVSATFCASCETTRGMKWSPTAPARVPFDEALESARDRSEEFERRFDDPEYQLGFVHSVDECVNWTEHRVTGATYCQEWVTLWRFGVERVDDGDQDGWEVALTWNFRRYTFASEMEQETSIVGFDGAKAAFDHLEDTRSLEHVRLTGLQDEARKWLDEQGQESVPLSWNLYGPAAMGGEVRTPVPGFQVGWRENTTEAGASHYSTISLDARDGQVLKMAGLVQEVRAFIGAEAVSLLQS